jgi:ketosteroid isomerase-like protein
MIDKKIPILLCLLPTIFFASFAIAGDKVAEQKELTLDTQSAKTLEVAKEFLTAAGTGDMETLQTLMTDDFVWHNEGDSSIPWIGPWEGKEVVLNDFMPKFGAGLKVTSWTTDYSFANGNQAVFVGTMSAIANNSGVDTGKFSWVVRVHVEDGQVKSWNWFEDSYAVSKAYHANK